MAELTAGTRVGSPRQSLVTLTHVIYALHGFSAAMGLLSSAFIVTSFLAGWPSILAVILNLVKRGDVRGSFLESHFDWQLRTFWYSLLWVIVAVLLAITLVGLVVAVPLAIGLGIWVLYRIVRGWLALIDHRPIRVSYL
ncbi:MAG TPA: hypothetical protein VED01_08015 [Burkholderiales bacterium]|nr:hypothetical protein [Burkholderiales bacterium]